ncbi:hypothetical protein [Vibrio porteresiae]|uniref:Lipoprotein n=1 Tax=Vibrio porteresiae DSM 19223 TaxID=1123496 RepID=A0ABZ0QLX8_9VIBR|nr:hypothetical protein [Vibrio porteresiae]WPC76411.1 hypothetical protein R8Z52_17940 [Vibrio porteresiae DSM 19223]
MFTTSQACTSLSHRTVLLVVAMVSLLSGCFSDSKAEHIRDYLQHNIEFTQNGWTITDVHQGSHGYYVSITMGHNDENSYKFLYNMAKNRRNKTKFVDNLDTTYQQRLKALCPNPQSERGEDFWQEMDGQKFFDMSITIKDFGKGVVAESYCHRPGA